MNQDHDNRIDRFRGEYSFLSNFYGCKIIIQTKDGQLTFWNAEAAFQAMKTTDVEERMKFCDIKNPVKAKGLGRKVKLRKDWDIIRVSVMEYIVNEKFQQNGDLAQKLLDTEGKQLIEGNNHNDKFWGMIPVPVGATDVWVGENHLGKILEDVRCWIRLSHPIGMPGKPIDYPPCHQSIDDFIKSQIMIVDEIDQAVCDPKSDEQRINNAVDLAWRYGGIDGDHHQKWLVDQMLRKMLTEKEYTEFVHDYEESGEYKWQTGIAP